MKKIGIRVCIAALLVALTASFAFAAGGLTIEETTPANGGKNAAVDNLGIKLVFSEPVGSEANQAANNKCFKLIGPEEKELPIKVYYNPKHEEQVLVIYDKEADENSLAKTSKVDIKLEIDGNFMANSGNILGVDEEIIFTTADTDLNNKVYTFIMIGMIGIMVFMSKSQTKKAKEEAEDAAGYYDEPFNPYKEAKRTGKSVEEVTRQHNREVARREARAARRAAEAGEEIEEYVEEESGNYKVKGPRPIAPAGGKYITGRKAAAEAAAAEEERLAKRRAARKKK